MTNHVIFAIDNNTSLHTVAKFLRMVDEKKALSHMSGPMAQCIGMWDGILEPSYMVTEEDFNTFVVNSGYVDNQDCFLYVPQDVKQPCDLRLKSGVSIGRVGRMKEVSATNAMSSKAWTFVINKGKYYATEA